MKTPSLLKEIRHWVINTIMYFCVRDLVRRTTVTPEPPKPEGFRDLESGYRLGGVEPTGMRALPFCCVTVRCGTYLRLRVQYRSKPYIPTHLKVGR